MLRYPLAPALAFLLAGCGASSSPPAPGSSFQPQPSPERQASEQALRRSLGEVKGLDTPGLLAGYPAAFTAALSYDPLKAKNVDLVQASPLALNAAETRVLGARGFVISDRQRFPAFPLGYEAVYAAHLPVFVSADAILTAVHRSYDDILKSIEAESLRPDLVTLLSSMRARLQAGAAAPFGPDAAKDADLFTAVALGLLQDGPVAPVAGAKETEIASLTSLARKGEGSKGLTLFGSAREMDFSQFTPRGHYSDSPELQSYFRASMWLGRTDLRIIETGPDGQPRFLRRQFDGMLALAALVDGPGLAAWQRLDRAIAAFVGETDNLRLDELPALVEALGVKSAAETKRLADGAIGAAITSGGFGAQRIASQIMVNGLAEGTLPLARAFLLLGQRYVIDSHVFSNVVYDRVQAGKQKRMMPDPLDVAFAALGNNQAATLLAPQLDRWKYAPDLAAMRLLADEHGEAYWSKTLYNLWLGALRALSSGAANQTGPLEVANTEGWGRRLLSTQLASWAELRHDTILYVKQSYTGGPSCDFPDALVEPNPDFFARLEAYAELGKGLVAGLEINGTTLRPALEKHFVRLGEVAGMLREMAERQRDGKPYTQTHKQFIDQMVKVQRVCGGASVQGWYGDLFFSPWTAADFKPTIADVHTQPKDEQGGDVGRVLHVGTGLARLMVVTANTCEGPRAYAGLASSYHEIVTDRYKRLDDKTWADMLMKTPPADVVWMRDLIAH